MNTTSEFECFLREHERAVYGTALQMLGSPTEAEDVAQEVFLRAHEHFIELKEWASPGGWLRTVTRNYCLNLLRTRGRCRLFSEFERDSVEWSMEELLASHGDVERSVAGRSVRQLLERVMQRLPLAQRVPLTLFHFEERSYEEIARRLKIPMAKVKTDIFRARRTLRRLLKPYAGRGLLNELAAEGARGYGCADWLNAAA